MQLPESLIEAQPNDQDEAYASLAKEVILRAILDSKGMFGGSIGNGYKAYRENMQSTAQVWLDDGYDEATLDDPMSFRWCCALLGIPPELILDNIPEHLHAHKAGRTMTMLVRVK